MITLVASLGGLLFGFGHGGDIRGIAFVQKQFQTTAFYEGWFVSSALVGCIIGVSVFREPQR